MKKDKRLNNGKYLKVMRAKESLTITELAKKAGLNYSTICLIENGYSIPNSITLGKLARALNIDVNKLFMNLIAN